MPPRPASLKVRALQWLAQREHSRDELRSKLLRLLQRQPAPQAEVDQDASAEVDALLVWLERHGHLSQSRFIESRVHARESRYGNVRIAQELRQHGITLAVDDQQALRASEFERAREVWRRKFGSPALDAAARVRQMRFLVGRGFSIDVVDRVVKAGAKGLDDLDEPAPPPG